LPPEVIQNHGPSGQLQVKMCQKKTSKDPTLQVWPPQVVIKTVNKKSKGRDPEWMDAGMAMVSTWA